MSLSIFIHLSYQLISLIYSRLHYLFSNFFCMPKHKFKGKLPTLSRLQLTLISWAWSKAKKKKKIVEKGNTPTLRTLSLRKSQSNRKVNSASRVRCAFVCISLGIFTKIFPCLTNSLVFLSAARFWAFVYMQNGFVFELSVDLLTLNHSTFTLTFTAD